MVLRYQVVEYAQESQPPVEDSPRNPDVLHGIHLPVGGRLGRQ